MLFVSMVTMTTDAGATSSGWSAPVTISGASTTPVPTPLGLTNVACVSAGNCVAIGTTSQSTSNGSSEIGVSATEVNGTWSSATQIPGVSDSTNASLSFNSLTCPSLTSCVVVWDLLNYNTNVDRYYISQDVAGTWSSAIAIPGLVSLSPASSGQIEQVACPSPGNCVVGGTFTKTTTLSEPFVVSEVNGAWGTSAQVPGTTALNHAGSQTSPSGGTVDDIWCADASTCVVLGSVVDAFGNPRVYASTETAGVWSNAVNIGPALAKSAASDDWVNVDGLSCVAAAYCSVVGQFGKASSQNGTTFVATDANGTWSAPTTVPGADSFSSYGSLPDVLTCTGVGDCVIGGDFTTGSNGPDHLYVATETNGSWASATRVLWTPSVGTATSSDFTSIVCQGDVTHCDAIGGFQDANGDSGTFVASVTGATWSTATEINAPGQTKNSYVGFPQTLICVSLGNCTAVAIPDILNNGSPASGVVSFAEVSGVWSSSTSRTLVGPGTELPLGFLEYLQCPSQGNCSAVGLYQDVSGLLSFGILADAEVNGTWGADQVLASPAGVGFVVATSLTCASAGNCLVAALGASDNTGGALPVVAQQVNGVWGSSEILPNFSSLGATEGDITDVSCLDADNCVVTGVAGDLGGTGSSTVTYRTYVELLTNGAWGSPTFISGTSTTMSTQSVTKLSSEIGASSLWCATIATCELATTVTTAKGHTVPAVATETGGTWSSATPVAVPAGTPATATFSPAALDCTTTSNCVDVGEESMNGGKSAAVFSLSEVNAVWTTRQVGNALGGNMGAIAIQNLSCPSLATCTLSGYATVGTKNVETGFLATSTKGVFSSLTKIPHLPSTATTSFVTDVSCWSVGNCAATGAWKTSHGEVADVQVESHGVWAAPTTVSPLAGSTNASSGLYGVACATTGHCTAVGISFGTSTNPTSLGSSSNIFAITD